VLTQAPVIADLLINVLISVYTSITELPDGVCAGVGGVIGT